LCVQILVYDTDKFAFFILSTNMMVNSLQSSIHYIEYVLREK